MGDQAKELSTTALQQAEKLAREGEDADDGAGGSSGSALQPRTKSEEELAKRDLIAGVDALTRPKLIDVSIPDRPREIKLCVLVCSGRVCVCSTISHCKRETAADDAEA